MKVPSIVGATADALLGYAGSEPGSAILRCCSAKTAAGVTFASACWTLFFQPETIVALPLMTAL